MARRGYIPDGYTYDGFIAGVTGIYDDVRFRYRPLTPLERSRLLTENGKQTDPAKVVENTCKVIAAKIVDWDLEDPATGDKIAVSWKVLHSNIEPALHDRLFGIIAGMEPSSPDPLKQAKESTLEQDKEAADSDQLIGDKLLEDQQKN
jgi:hypothetical protein